MQEYLYTYSDSSIPLFFSCNSSPHIFSKEGLLQFSLNPLRDCKDELTPYLLSGALPLSTASAFVRRIFAPQTSKDRQKIKKKERKDQRNALDDETDNNFQMFLLRAVQSFRIYNLNCVVLSYFVLPLLPFSALSPADSILFPACSITEFNQKFSLVVSTTHNEAAPHILYSPRKYVNRSAPAY